MNPYQNTSAFGNNFYPIETAKTLILNNLLIIPFITTITEIIKYVLGLASWGLRLGLSKIKNKIYKEHVIIIDSSYDGKGDTNNQILINALMHDAKLDENLINIVEVKNTAIHKIQSREIKLYTAKEIEQQRGIVPFVKNFYEDGFHVSYDKQIINDTNANDRYDLNSQFICQPLRGRAVAENANVQRQIYQERISITSKKSYSEIRNYIEEKKNAYLNVVYGNNEQDIYYLYQKDKSDRECYGGSGDTYEKMPLNINKDVTNVFLPNKEDLINKILGFKNSVDKEKKLGIMLHGVSGCGKTSLIQLIAKLLERHVILINTKHISSPAELNNVFFKNLLFSKTENGNSCIEHIALEKRIIVLEEIDTMVNFQSREKNTNQSKYTHPFLNGGGGAGNGIGLYDLLTLFQGFKQLKSVVYIITTNHMELLDKALVRPGRIDMLIHLGYMKRAEITEALEYYYIGTTQTNLIDEIATKYDGNITPALLENVCQNYSIEKVFDKINEYKQNDEEMERKKMEYENKDKCRETRGGALSQVAPLSPINPLDPVDPVDSISLPTDQDSYLEKEMDYYNMVACLNPNINRPRPICVQSLG